MTESFASVEEYLGSLDPRVRSALEEVRATIHDALPGAVEAMSYNMPVVTLGDRRVVHYAGWKAHISLYPLPDDDDLAAELAPYAAGKGTLKFPLDQPMPHDLIARVAQRLSLKD